MNKEQWTEIMAGRLPLTAQDKKEGWHFCPSWDGLLIGPGEEEYRFCDCE